MTNAVKLKEHFNLYYIFEEDKRKNALAEKKASDIWKFREQIDEYISNENLRASKQEAMAFANGCSFAMRFWIECLSK